MASDNIIYFREKRCCPVNIPKRKSHNDIPRKINPTQSTKKSIIHISQLCSLLFHSIKSDRIFLHDFTEIPFAYYMELRIFEFSKKSFIESCLSELARICLKYFRCKVGKVFTWNSSNRSYAILPYFLFSDKLSEAFFCRVYHA